jgi:hypothetical protein
MKRFIFKTLLFLLPIVILAVPIEYLLQQIPNNYTYKKNYLDKHAGEIQVLILGASDLFFGLDPVYFKQNTFNASHVSQTLDWDYKIFSKYQDRFDDLKIVIIPISYPTLWAKLEEGVESWRTKNYAIYYGLATKSWMNHSELLKGKLSVNIQRLYQYYFKGKSDISCTELGWGTDYKSGNTVDLEKSGKAAALYHTYKNIYSEENTKIFTENLAILNSFIEICTEKNMELIFLTPPAYYTYRENLNIKQWNKMLETMTDLVKGHNNCQYINMMDDRDFTAEDFYDANHLDERGAKKFSEKIVHDIDSLSIFK